jgi:hypothetical protein
MDMNSPRSNYNFAARDPHFDPAHTHLHPLPLDPRAAALSEQVFPTVKNETMKRLTTTEEDVLVLPWGPRIDVMIEPRRHPGIVGGRARLMARTRFSEIEIASATFTSMDAPITLSGGHGCDEYVIRAAAFTDPGINQEVPESFFYARIYEG